MKNTNSSVHSFTAPVLNSAQHEKTTNAPSVRSTCSNNTLPKSTFGHSYLNCLVLNADTLSNKMHELQSLLSQDTNLDIIIINEVKPKNHRYQMAAVDFALEGYSTFCNNLDSNTGRGLIIYTKHYLEASPLDLASEFSEYVSVKIPLKKHKMLTLVGIYKSPDTTDDNETRLFELIKEASNFSSHVLITGDFNYPGIDWDTLQPYAHSTKNTPFLECVRDSYLWQHVTSPTRGRLGQNPSTLDLILTNEEQMVENLNMLSPLGKKVITLASNFISYATKKKYLSQEEYFSMTRESTT